MLKLDRIVGSCLDPALAEQLHALEHRGLVEHLVISKADSSRRRLRATTSAGTDVAVALSRAEKLYDGAVLLIEPERAIVIRAATEQWLRLAPRSLADAIELGYHAGNLHWRVRFDEDVLLVSLEAPVADYLARLQPLMTGERVTATVLGPEGDAA